MVLVLGQLYILLSAVIISKLNFDLFLRINVLIWNSGICIYTNIVWNNQKKQIRLDYRSLDLVVIFLSFISFPQQNFPQLSYVIKKITQTFLIVRYRKATIFFTNLLDLKKTTKAIKPETYTIQQIREALVLIISYCLYFNI